MEKSILVPGRNCWRTVGADRFALLYDSSEYFDAFFDLASKSKSSILLVGWEAEPKLALAKINRRYPDNLRTYFKRLTKNSQNLRVFISVWKPALYLKFSREFFAPSRWRFLTGSRVSYRQEKAPLAFGSNHEKIATIDNCAFLGGIDISERRWSRRTHTPLEERCPKSANGKRYNPRHDVQAVFSGQAAEALREYSARRFDKPLPSPDPRSKSWPAKNRPGLTDVELGLSRTDPVGKRFEIEQFYLDAINEAKEYIFIENQYFTHMAITRALARKLQSEDGPEVLINLPFTYPGFFERAVYASERAKVLRRLIKADRYKRLRIVYPGHPSQSKKRFIIVHSKLMAIDDRILTLGSANLNERSMRFDCEINLSIDARSDKKTHAFIREAVEEILSEHLALPREHVKNEWKKRESLITAVDTLANKSGKTLKALPMETLPVREKIFLFLVPFVDLRFAVPKTRFNLMLVVFVLFCVAAAGAAYAP